MPSDRRRKVLANKQERKKLALFHQYNLNLNLMTRHPEIQFNGDISSAILCPLCLSAFYRDDINTGSLTLDHVPPRTAGGRGAGDALVCKDCNSSLGASVDASLGEHLRKMDITSFTPGSQGDISYSWENGKRIPASLQIGEDGSLKLTTHSFRTHPDSVRQLAERLDALVELGESAEYRFQLHVTLPDSQSVSVALLRIAYMIYFMQFGYGAILHPHFNRIRAQICEPTSEQVLAEWDVSRVLNVDRLQDGIHFVHEPVDLRCVLVGFTLSVGLSPRNYIICLPVHISPGISIYSRLMSIKHDGAERHLKLISIPPSLGEMLWTDPNTHQAPYYFATFGEQPS